MKAGRLRAVLGIAIRAAARPGQRHLVYLCAVLVGAAIGLVIGHAVVNGLRHLPDGALSLFGLGRGPVQILSVM